MKSKFELFREKAFGILEASGFDTLNNLACQYELILEAGLKTVSDRVMFPAIGWRGARECITEIRLQQQDVFICNEWGLFLLNTHSESDVTFEEHTYLDPVFFTEESAKEADIFWNADLSFIVNNVIVLPGVRTDKFKVYRSCIERREYGLSGLVEIEDGCLILTGSKNIYFNLDLPRKADLNDSTIRLRLRLKGLLCRNAAIIT